MMEATGSGKTTGWQTNNNRADSSNGGLDNRAAAIKGLKELLAKP
jgi:hypothetical protein